MRILLAIIFILALSVVSYLQFSDITKVKDATLVDAVTQHLIKSHRQNSAESFNQSLETESFGQILNRAADLLTTKVNIVQMKKSEALLGNPINRHVIIDVSYFLEQTSAEPDNRQAFLTFTAVGKERWIYRHNSTELDFYLNYLGFE